MKLLHRPSLLLEHIQKCNMQTVFSFDVSSIADLFSFRRGEFLVELDTPSDYIYFLTSGEILVYTYTVSEKLHSQDYYCGISPVIGEVSILWGNPPNSTVQALTSGTCVGISVKKHGKILLNDNRFLRYVCQTMSERLCSSGFITSLDPVEVRFAAFLMANNTDGLFSFKLSTCADLLDTSYRHLFRVINKLISIGILRKTENGYQILDKDVLLQLSRGKLELSMQ